MAHQTTSIYKKAFFFMIETLIKLNDISKLYE